MQEEEFEEVIHQYIYAKKMLETELDILITEFVRKHQYNPVEHVKSRLKSKESIQEKLIKHGYEINISNMCKYINDIIGVRIVCSFLSDVYDIVSVISNSHNIEIIQKKDYISKPKDTGYSSYHLIVNVPIYLQNHVKYVKAEIQIRTSAMDFWASLDHKIRYKFSGNIPDDVKSQMYNYSLMVKELDKKMLILNEIVNKYK